MSTISDKMEKDISKYNDDCQKIIDGTWDLLQDKDVAAAIESLSLILVNLIISEITDFKKRNEILKALIDNLKKYIEPESNIVIP